MPRGSRSTLGDGKHRFPAFYACYLLKSVRTPKSTATYVGSTPNPPRRIRQHNGEITAGAWKTARNRPWVMQMIVHGFPSKLSALQFEWAWQHPHSSRHLKDPKDPTARAHSVFDYRGQRPLKGNITIVKKMLAMHPYVTWPLHVKLFTREAVKHWFEASVSDSSSSSSNPRLTRGALKEIPGAELLEAGMPKGLTVKVEMEGVDGKTGQKEDIEKGRGGPIEVMDASFTSAHLAKHTRLLSQGLSHKCVVCDRQIDIAVASADALSLYLCPEGECTTLAHLGCMARHFLRYSPSSSSSELIPRGGSCPGCKEYVLWGDVIRGCYRRSVGMRGVGKQVEEEEEEMDADGGNSNGSEEDGEEMVTEVSRTPKRAKTSLKGKARVGVPSKAKKDSTASETKTIRKRRVPRKEKDEESERETFDLDAVSGSESNEERALARSKSAAASRLRKEAYDNRASPKSSQALKSRMQMKSTRLEKLTIGALQENDSEGEFFDLNAITSGSESAESSPSFPTRFSPLKAQTSGHAKTTAGPPPSRLARQLSSLSISSPPSSPQRDVIILSD